MDRILRRELDAIAHDRMSGAAELTVRATKALATWLRRTPRQSAVDLQEVALDLYTAQPAMAPLLRLANEFALASQQTETHRLLQNLSRYRYAILHAPGHIARGFRNSLPRTRMRVLTYSFSSTVLGALLAARKRIRTVVCSESRPGNEGRLTAMRLAEGGIWVQFRSDADLFGGVLDDDHVVVGADSVFCDGFINKVGTRILAEQALNMGARVWILADTLKFWPDTHIGYLGRAVRGLSTGSCESIWPTAPQGVDAVYVSFSLFQHTRFRPGMAVLTEKGRMTPARVRREIAKIKLSPRLKELLD